MNLEQFVLEIVEKTNGWVLVFIVAMYIGYRIYKEYKEGAALKQTLQILDQSLMQLLQNIDRSVRALSASVDRLLVDFPRR